HECPYVQPEHREVQLIKRLQQFVPDALPVVRKACWYCRQCRHAYYGERYCTHCQTGRFSEDGEQNERYKNGAGDHAG
ncbi:TPA: putative zinc ribbon protein, partial [Escherichia coli O25b:H4-ST131]